MLARVFRGNDDAFSSLRQRLYHPLLRVVGFVGETLAPSVSRSALQIMGLPGREVKAGRIAQRIDRGVNLGAQAATAAPDGLALLRPLFLAPALCWCALTMVESIMQY